MSSFSPSELAALQARCKQNAEQFRDDISERARIERVQRQSDKLSSNPQTWRPTAAIEGNHRGN